MESARCDSADSAGRSIARTSWRAIIAGSAENSRRTSCETGATSAVAASLEAALATSAGAARSSSSEGAEAMAVDSAEFISEVMAIGIIDKLETIKIKK